MNLPRGSASTLLSLAAGGLTAGAVASAWFPMMHEAAQRESDATAEQIRLVAHVVQQHLDGTRLPLSLEGAAQEETVRAGLATLGDRAHIYIFGPGDHLLLSTDSPHEAAPASLPQSCSRIIVSTITDGSGRVAACAPLQGGGRVIAIAPPQPGLQRVRTRATAMLLGLGALAGLVVIAGVRWLLSPIQEVSEAAARISAGERKVRVTPRGPEEIAQLGRAVNSLASNFEAREDEIRSRLNVVTQLSSMVAHEVRNPLQSLSLLCTLARTEDDHETRDQLLQSIDTEIHVLEGVVQRFLRNSGPLQISRSATDLVEIVNRAAAVAEPQARARHVSLIVQAPARMKVTVDGSLVRRAMENLLLNAIEWASQAPPGHVTASVIPQGAHVVLIVDDDGPGVPDDTRERIFQAYFSSKSGGTGLGLALVKQVFEAHGGTIRCEDSPLGGARFLAHLPLTATPGGHP